MDGAFSGYTPMLPGVPRGSLLYNLYTSDIPKSIVSKLVLYADDIYIYHQTKKPKYAYLSVQHHPNDIGRWASRSRIRQMQKNSVPLSSPEGIKSACLKFTLNNVQVDYVQECRYLGGSPAS